MQQHQANAVPKPKRSIRIASLKAKVRGIQGTEDSVSKNSVAQEKCQGARRRGASASCSVRVVTWSRQFEKPGLAAELNDSVLTSEVPVPALRSFPTNSSIGETLGHDLAMIAQLYKETDPPVFIHR